MEYQFSLKKQALRRIVCALTLDKKNMTERIVIGEATEVRLRLERGIDEVYYDKTRPMGTLLIDFETDKQREWTTNAMNLYKSYNSVLASDKTREKSIHTQMKFLQNKHKSGEPSAMFAAIHTWEEYVNCYNLNHGADLFIERTAALYRPFYRDEKLWHEAEALTAVKPVDSQAELWYPATKRPFECVVGFASFLPLISYYLHKIREWNYVFQACKVCKSEFLARSRRYELCSDKCRKVQAVEAKREFDERAKNSWMEQLDESAYYYWYNRLRKLRKGKIADSEKAAAVGTAFKAFRKEAIKRKNMVKCGKIALSEYSEWIIAQQDELDKMMGTNSL